MSYHRIAAASPPVKVGDVTQNKAHISKAMVSAKEAGAGVVVFPELAITGYSCGDLFSQTTLLRAARQALSELAKETGLLDIAVVVGLPVAISGRLYNCGAFLANGMIKGIVPKVVLPNSGEYYERRWFSSGLGLQNTSIIFERGSITFGPDQLFHDSESDLVIGIELCEDLWAVIPPSSNLCLAGANLVLNLSASSESLGKANYRRNLVQQQSARALCAYAYASAGPGESSSDVVFSGHCLIAENGVLLAESERLQIQGVIVVADIDIERIDHDRRANASFSSFAPNSIEKTPVQIRSFQDFTCPLRPNPKHPFVPTDATARDSCCEEIFALQTTGLIKRLLYTNITKVTIGVSGGLDSTLALLVCVSAFDILNLPRSGILAVSLPGFGTTSRTVSNATALAAALGVEFRSIDIKESVTQHFADINHPSTLFDLTFENAQARERTQILMDLANQTEALVVGTGDLSEAALGWCTFNGDHMSMYHVNIGVPKTLVKYLVKWCAESEFAGAPKAALNDIVSTPISPELLPLDSFGNQMQKTEETIGPFELHDFFLYHSVRFGSSPRKIAVLAEQAFLGDYSREQIVCWLNIFYTRFFCQQFKRSSMPDGPKVGSIALSPRGDWRMPSDAQAAEWLNEVRLILDNELRER